MRFGGFGFNRQFGFGSSPAPRASGGGAVELWPQPDFAASTGITLDAGGGTMPTISGGKLTFFNDGDPATATATAVAPLTAGSYHYAITVDSLTGSLFLFAGGTGPDNFEAAGTYSGDFPIAGNAGDDIQLGGGFTAAVISHFSLTKNP